MDAGRRGTEREEGEERREGTQQLLAELLSTRSQLLGPVGCTEVRVHRGQSAQRSECTEVRVHKGHRD